MSLHRALAPAILALALATPAIMANAAEPLRVGASFITSGLDPAKGSNGWALVSHGIGENLFTVDKNGVLTPELAAGAERVDELTWIVRLKPGRQFSDGTPVTAGCRSVKSEAELALLQIANDATLACYHAVWQALQPGMTQQDVQALVALAYGRLGVRGDVDINVGKYTAQPHGSIEPQKIDEGTVVILDDGCQVHGYTSDITRTLVLGKASDKMKRVFSIVQKAQIAARDAARTGGKMGDIDAAARKVIADAGYGPGYTYFSHRLGHGIGMDMHEWYYAVGGSEQPIVANMTMSDEPGIYIPGEFGVRLEDCMVTTDNGGRWFTAQSPSIELPFG